MLLLGHNLFLKVLQIRSCIGAWCEGDILKDDFGTKSQALSNQAWYSYSQLYIGLPSLSVKLVLFFPISRVINYC